MTCRIGLVIGVDRESEGEPGTSQTFDVEQAFEEVLDAIMPENPPTSALGHRNKMTYTLTDGGRVFLHPQNVAWVREMTE